MSRRREYPARPILGVGVLIEEESRYLLIRRAANPDWGLWSVPGGLIEVGETAVESAVREAFEETGLRVEVTGRLGVVDKIEYDAADKVLYHFIIIQFHGVPISGMLKPADDALDAVWVTRGEMKTYELTGSLRTFLVDIGFFD